MRRALKLVDGVFSDDHPTVRALRERTARSAPLDLGRALAPLEQDHGPFARSTLAELDRADAFPQDACRALDELGLHRQYVPAEHGGELVDHPDAHQLIRAVASHDLTVAIAHGKTYLGAVSVWLDGHPRQVSLLADHILRGGLVAWGLTEAEHGSDLVATELSAVQNGDEWRLDGEKWLINNATRAELICVLARTGPASGLRAHSLFLVDKRKLAHGSWRCLPKIRTYGIRGADISGIAFSGAAVPADAIVGRIGHGLPTVIRSLQLTRIACSALSLGAADHALALTRELLVASSAAGTDLAVVPEIRRRLGRAAARALVAAGAATVAGRSVHALPSELSVISAVTKAFVPTTIDQLLADLTSLLGPHGLLDESFGDGAFVKLERDHRIVAIFDGSTAVNRAALIGHLARLGDGYGELWDREGLQQAATLDAPLPPFAPSALRLTSPRSSVVAALPATIAALQRRSEGSDLLRLARILETTTARLHRRMREAGYAARNIPSEAFVTAQRYELCFAAAACLLLGLLSPARRSGDLELRGCLVYALEMLGVPLSEADLSVYDRLVGVAFARPHQPMHQMC